MFIKFSIFRISKKINDIKKIDINLPPIELQNKFAKRVEKVEKLEFKKEIY